jgi:hypothetical protein
MILDTNVVLDMLIFDDPDIPAIRELVARGEVRWIADEAQRIELGACCTTARSRRASATTARRPKA